MRMKEYCKIIMYLPAEDKAKNAKKTKKKDSAEDDVELRQSEDESCVEPEDSAIPAPHHRPPIYNPEDYAHALSKYSRASNLYVVEQPRDKKGRLREKEKAALKEAPPEMSLKQFSSLPELLKKLKEDLKMAYLSFVKELVRDPNDGVTLLLDVLKMVQLSQTDLHGCISSREQQSALRKALVDEHECLSCLRYCLRSSDAALKLAHYHYGLYALAVATMSNLARSRTLALQLLTRACETSPAGHRQVIDALATLRLRFGEPVRCKFLVSMMLSHPQPSFQMWALRFVNTLLSTTDSLRERVYLQEELAEAGFDPAAIRKMLERGGTAGDAQHKTGALVELGKWTSTYIDVEALGFQLQTLREANTRLQEELKKLREANMKLLEENVLLKAVGGEVEERCAALQRRLEHHGLPTAPSPVPSVTDSDLSSMNTIRNCIQNNGDSSTKETDEMSTFTDSGPSSTVEVEVVSPSEVIEAAPPDNSKVKLASKENSRCSSQSRSDTSTLDSSKTVCQVSSFTRIRNGLPHQNGLKHDPHTQRSDSLTEARKRSSSRERYNERMPQTQIEMTLREQSSDNSVQSSASTAEKGAIYDGRSKSSSSKSDKQPAVSKEVGDQPSYANIIVKTDRRDSGVVVNGVISGANEVALNEDKKSNSSKKSSISSSVSSLSSARSSSSSSSSSSSTNRGDRRNQEYQNIPKRDQDRPKFRVSEEGDMDYERNVIVYEAIALGNETIFVDKNGTQYSQGSGRSGKSSESFKSSGSLKEGPNVKESVRHYENLAIKGEDESSESSRRRSSEDRNSSDSRSDVQDYGCRKERKLLPEREKSSNDEVTEQEVEVVINGLEKVIQRAESSMSLVSQGTMKDKALRDLDEDRASPEQVTEEIEIVPTRIPQLPARARHSPCQDATQRDPLIFVEYESPDETSDSDNFLRNRAPSPRTIETESTKSFGFVRPEKMLKRHETFMERSNSGREGKKRGLRRSESFQMGNKDDYNSHRSYSPKRRGSSDLLVPFEESEVSISGRTFMRYTPQEVERRNKMNDLITAELNRRKNRSMEDRLDYWFDDEEEWTLRWKYPDIEPRFTEPEPVKVPRQKKIKNENKLKKLSKSKFFESKSSSKSSLIGNEVSSSRSGVEQPLRPARVHRFNSAEISAFNGFKNPKPGFRESDYGPNFMLNKPSGNRGQYISDIADYGGRDYALQKTRGGRRRGEFDPDIPTPDYTATPAGTMSTIMNGTSPHILDMTSGLY